MDKSTDYAKVVIASEPRSGTNLLAHSLSIGRKPRRAYHRYEPFDPNDCNPYGGFPVEDALRYGIFRPLDPEVEIVTAVLHGFHQQGPRGVEVWEALRGYEGIRYVLLRRDAFARGVSRMLAWRSGIWCETIHSGPTPQDPLTVNPVEILRDYKRSEANWENYLTQTDGRDARILNYDYLASNWREAMTSLFEWLEIETPDLDVPPIEKQVRKPLRDLVTNWEECREAFKGLPFYDLHFLE